MNRNGITFIHLKNFKSFSDVTIDFSETQNNPKSIAVIFGENGSGKSTIIESIHFLSKLICTRSASYQSDQLLHTLQNTDNDSVNRDKIIEQLLETYQGGLNQIKPLLSDYKAINSENSLSVTYGFRLNGYDGEYSVEFDDKYITYEKMIYQISGRKATYWEISKEESKVKLALFPNNKYYSKELTETLDKYWGKHTFLSLLEFEIKDKTVTFIQDAFCMELQELIKFLSSFSYRINHFDNTVEELKASYIYRHLESGYISTEKESELDQVAQALTTFLCSIFHNIQKAYYFKQMQNDEINYTLMLRKTDINGTFDIPFDKESCGTIELLSYLPYFVLAMRGNVVFIDEFGNSMHEQLVPAIVNAISQKLKGQLIMTSHHLSILDKANLTGDVFYYITSGMDSAKQVLCTSDIEDRLNKGYNYRNRYLSREQYHMQEVHTKEDTYINFDDFLD